MVSIRTRAAKWEVRTQFQLEGRYVPCWETSAYRTVEGEMVRQTSTKVAYHYELAGHNHLDMCSKVMEWK